MSKTISLVQRVEIASPCPASWDSMVGDERVRFCGQCQRHVYNLSAMTAAEGEQLIIEKEGKLCAQIYRRSDGTVLTSDCPVGLAAVRSRIRKTAMRTAAAVAFIVCAIGLAIIQGPQSARDVGSRNAYQAALRSIGRWMEGFRPTRMRGGCIVILPTSPRCR